MMDMNLLDEVLNGYKMDGIEVIIESEFLQ